MKTKHLLTALVLPALFAACTEDTFENSVNNGNANLNGQLVELGKDFAVGLTRGGDDAATRTNWHYTDDVKGLYSWLPRFNAAGDAACVENIGFAWRGEVGDAKVRTNYKFQLSGVLAVGETKPETLICDDELAVKNGYLFEKDAANCEVVVNNSVIKLLGYNKNTKKNDTEYAGGIKYDGTTGAYTVGSYSLEDALDASALNEGDPYVRNGIFTTENSTVFKGDYIVYFPYDPDFAEIDYLPATTPTIFTQDYANPNKMAHLGGKTFGYGHAQILEGGSMAESFTTENLSSVIDLKITSKQTNVKLSKIILVDETADAKGFIKEVGLDASKIAANAKGTALYVDGTQVYEPTIVLNTINGTDAFVTMDAAKEFTVATLPTTVGTLVAYLMDDEGMCLRKQVTTNWTMTPGAVRVFNVEIGANDKFNQRLAVDTKTLIESISDAGAGTAAATVRTLGNITLDKTAQIELANGKTGTLATGDLFGLGKVTSVYVAQNVNVTGTGTITVPSDIALTFKAVDKKSLSFENPIVIENAGCCGKQSAQIFLMSADGKEGTIVFNGDVTNYGAMYLANNSDNVNGTTITFNGALKNLVDDYSDENADARIYCYGAEKSVINFNGDVENEGVIEIANKCIQMEDGTTESNFTTERGVVVNAKNITNAKDATISVGAYTRFAVAGTATNNGSINVATSGTGINTTDGELYIGTSGSLANAGLLENYGVVNNEGALRNTDTDADIVDHVGSQFGGNKAQATPGEYICDVEDTNVDKEGDRVAYAMGDNMPTTTIRFVGEAETEGETDQYVYNLAGYKSGNVLPYNFIIATDPATKVVLNGLNRTTAQDVTITGTLTVNKDAVLDLSQIKLAVNGVVTVDGEMNVKPTVDGANTTEADGTNAFTAASDVNVNGSFDVAQFVRTDLNNNMTIARNASATFNYASYTDIAHVLNINGTFTRVVSTGAETANPAQVWVESYTKGANAVIPNGLPQGR